MVQLSTPWQLHFFFQVKSRNLLMTFHVNISCVFIIPFQDWSSKVDRDWWEIRTLTAGALGCILYFSFDGNLHHVLFWIFSTKVIEKSMYAITRFVCWYGEGVLRISFFFFDKAQLSELLSCYRLKINLIWQSTWSIGFVILDDSFSLRHWNPLG